MSSGNNKISGSLNPHSLSPLKLQVYWALDQLESPERDKFTSLEIVEFLVNNPRITTSRQAVEYSLKSDRKSIYKTGKYYKLMEHGRNQLRIDKENVILIDPGKPFSGKKLATSEVFSKLKGEVRICDPYCGPGLLDFIFKSIKKESPVKILTQKLIDKPHGTFDRALVDLRKEGFTVEVRIYNKSELHDRYIIDDREIWLSGNSFNDLGNKESFIVLLGKDIRQSVSSTFDNRWKTATIK